MPLRHLPPLTELCVSLIACEPCRLAALPTTSLHGALGHALLERDRDAFETLCQPRPKRQGGGVTTVAPAALVLRFDEAVVDEAPRELDAGEALPFRVLVLGAEALACLPVLRGALRDAAERGLGQSLAHPSRHSRFELGPVSEPEVELVARAPRLARLETLSPLRLERGHRLAPRLTPDLLWLALLRRLDLVSAHLGGGRLFAGRPPPCGFELEPLELGVVALRRYSARQGQGMTWEGFVGSGLVDFTPAGPERGALAWQLLALGARLGIGKGTSLGFGAFRLCAVQEWGEIAAPMSEPPPEPPRAIPLPLRELAALAARHYVDDEGFRAQFEEERARRLQALETLRQSAETLGYALVPREPAKAGAARPKSTLAKPSGSKRRPAKTSADVQQKPLPPQDLDRAIVALLARGGPASRGTLAEALGVEASELTVPLRRLRKARAITKSGTTRAALYRAVAKKSPA